MIFFENNKKDCTFAAAINRLGLGMPPKAVREWFHS